MGVSYGTRLYTPYSSGVILGLCFTGVGTTLFTTAISALASHRAKPAERGLVMGVIQFMQSFGRSMGPLIVGNLFALWEGLPYLAGALLLAIALVWRIILVKKITT